jgi:hypothetical protein
MLSNCSSTDPLSRWNQLYQCAIQELDNARLPERVAEARHAILDRAEELLRHPLSEERHALKHALRTLKLLEEKAAREKSAAVHRPEMVKEIESLFDTLCAHPPMARLCESCGAEKFNLNATVSLADSDRCWNVRLPVCPKCDRDEYLKLILPGAA